MKQYLPNIIPHYLPTSSGINYKFQKLDGNWSTGVITKQHHPYIQLSPKSWIHNGSSHTCNHLYFTMKWGGEEWFYPGCV